MPKKTGFLIAMYATLISQLFITFAIVYWFRNHPKLSAATKRSFLLYLLLSLGLILLLAFVPMPTYLQLIVFSLFAIVTGAMLHQATSIIPKEVVDQALRGAIAIFVTMSIIGVTLYSMGVDLAWMGWLLFAALIGLLVASIVVLVLPKTSSTRLAYKIITIIGLTLFAVYVIYHTNIVLQKNYRENFVQAALDFYLDFINIFIRVLILDSAA